MPCEMHWIPEWMLASSGAGIGVNPIARSNRRQRVPITLFTVEGV